MKISAIDQQKGCCKHIHRFFPQRILDESPLLPAPPEKTEGDRNQRWKTESNGEPFSAHPGAIHRFCPFSSVLPSRSLACALIPPALPGTLFSPSSGSTGNTKSTGRERAKKGLFARAFPRAPRRKKLPELPVIPELPVFPVPQPILDECAHPFGSAGNAFQPEFWEYWEY